MNGNIVEISRFDTLHRGAVTLYTLFAIGKQIKCCLQIKYICIYNGRCTFVCVCVCENTCDKTK